MSHQTEAFSLSSWVAFTAPTITTADKPVINSPSAILAGVLGSFPLFFKKPNITTIKGVNKTTQPGLID